MNNYGKYIREKTYRDKLLFVVEGNDEKDKLLKLILKVFPQIPIDMNNIIIYETNIYSLYHEIAMEYGHDWIEKDIDIAFLVSKKINSNQQKYKKQFTNIFLVFDYERHDPEFSEIKIKRLQEYFIDAADMGMLYINYPTIESYMHLKNLPDNEYLTRSIPVTLQPGSQYKNLAKRESVIYKLLQLPDKMDKYLKEKCDSFSEKNRTACVEAILSMDSQEKHKDNIKDILSQYVEKDKLHNADCYIKSKLQSIGCLEHNKSYYNFVQDIFKQIIRHNIMKAYYIQKAEYIITEDDIEKSFYNLNYVEIVDKQNSLSSDSGSGIVYILNTCIFIVPDYNMAFMK